MTREDEMVAERLREIVPTLEEQWPHAALIVKASLESLTALSSERDLLVERVKQWALDKSATHHRFAVEDEHLRAEHIASSSAYRNLAEEIESVLTGVTGG